MSKLRVGDRVVLRAGTIVAVHGHDLVRVRIDGDNPVGRPDQTPSFDMFVGGIRYRLEPAAKPKEPGGPIDPDTLVLFPELES